MKIQIQSFRPTADQPHPTNDGGITSEFGKRQVAENLSLCVFSVFSTSRLYIKTRKSGPCFFDAPVGITSSLVYIEAMSSPPADLEKFKFRKLNPLVKIGTASDRYARVGRANLFG
jgi:hypothetical protein